MSAEQLAAAEALCTDLGKLEAIFKRAHVNYEIGPVPPSLYDETKRRLGTVRPGTLVLMVLTDDNENTSGGDGALYYFDLEKSLYHVHYVP